MPSCGLQGTERFTESCRSLSKEGELSKVRNKKSSSNQANPDAKDISERIISAKELDEYIAGFHFTGKPRAEIRNTEICEQIIDGFPVKKYINEFWTSKQRNACSLHEISYRACFKPQLPRFFIELLTKPGDTVYDPFGGRGTTVIEAALCKRKGISNDINPLSEIMAYPRLFLPNISDVKERLNEIELDKTKKSDTDLSMFYHEETLAELLSLKEYLSNRKKIGEEDLTDKWIRMVATSRLTGHSTGFFSVYTLPPNQAVSKERQIIINKSREQTPEYRDVKKLIIRKSVQLLGSISDTEMNNLVDVGKYAKFVNSDSRYTKEIPDNSVQLTVTSPPFLNIVNYSEDNWLRCWFNEIDSDDVGNKITMAKTVEEWSGIMGDVFKELFRITKNGGWVAFEVGEIRNKSVCLDDYVVPLGIDAGFELFGVLINEQKFTKTSNIWGMSNNKVGTNSNRIVIFVKE